MFISGQIPHGEPLPKDKRFFPEFFVGTRYLDAGFDVLSFYRAAEHKPSYEKAKDLLGGTEAIEFINPGDESKGRPPDLLVFNQAGQFKFVECKRKNEKLTDSQIIHFPRIEEYLKENCAPSKRLAPT